MKVLSTYRFQILGLRVAFAIACSSNSSIRFARTQTSAVSEFISYLTPRCTINTYFCTSCDLSVNLITTTCNEINFILPADENQVSNDISSQRRLTKIEDWTRLKPMRLKIDNSIISVAFAEKSRDRAQYGIASAKSTVLNNLL